ncbi:MAG: T9SS type A sorting domain-containing protein, partial [Saprospiraceae bacterium]
RSFSIFDAYGNMVYDSGEDFGRAVAAIEPSLFNNDEGEKDGRSDDKGVEPEAIAIGTIGDYTYAFVGFERQSAIVVYDISNPFSPEFITYYQNSPDGVSGDVSPEIIKFVSAAESPNEENLLVVGYEISGSVGVIQVGGELVSISESLAENDLFEVYPNPTVNYLNLNENLSGYIFDANGVQVQAFENVNSINVSKFAEGVYTVSIPGKGSKRFLKLN